jgi:hypothetical protein
LKLRYRAPSRNIAGGMIEAEAPAAAGNIRAAPVLRPQRPATYTCQGDRISRESILLASS